MLGEMFLYEEFLILYRSGALMEVFCPCSAPKVNAEDDTMMTASSAI